MYRFINSFGLIYLVLIVPLSLGGCSGGDGGDLENLGSISPAPASDTTITDPDTSATDPDAPAPDPDAPAPDPDAPPPPPFGSGDNDNTVDTGNFQTPTLSCGEPTSVCYDIVYVRYPLEDPFDIFVTLSRGEHPYEIAAGADLMLLKPDGTEKVLVDCITCSVMDPAISHDGKTVYYTLIENAAINSASWIYKIHLDDPSYTPIRLTFDDGFDSVLYQGNRDASGKVKDGHDQSRFRKIRDMAPWPLADGRLVFTSNRSALTTFHPFSEAVIKGSMQMLYVMDDHDGSANTKELSNLHLLETGNIHMVQHPIQLMDGRLLFSTWQDAGTKFDGKYFRYAMTPLFTVNPDGSNLQQFTEPHSHKKTVDHFHTQLPGGEIVWENYYPGDWGYGLLMRAPLDPPGPDFLRGSIDQRYPYGNQYKISFREYDRKGMVTITPHSNNNDLPANNLSGKYSMPSVTSNGNLLVAYSTGGVSTFVADAKDPLKSGIYMILNASGDESSFITDPVKQLIKVKDDPNYNEIWPRAVLSYGDIYGISKPDILNDLSRSVPDDTRLQAGEANALLGTSSMYNREPLNEKDPDPFQGPGGNRENHDGNWTIQGAEAGVFTDDDIYAVRIIATPPKPFTSTIDKTTGNYEPCTPDGSDAWSKICRHLPDSRLSNVVARFGSYHGERWEILGEFPVKKSDVTDGQGNPDTSWQAKIPADTPTFIQTIDKKGMTLISEITWRALKSGEKRTDCGGCHAHSVEPLEFDTTEAGKGKPIVNVPGVNSTDPEVKDGTWDLTLNKIPLLSESGVTFEPGYSYGVEFNRDVVPVLNRRCVSCHKAGGSGNMFILDGSGGRDAWSVISEDGSYDDPQRSRYIRIPQARQSLFVWAAWGERLDGRTNSERSNDIDYPGEGDPADPHKALAITDKEKRTIARWVDLGGPIDFPETNGFGYTDDYQLPVVNVYTPFAGNNSVGTELRVGFADAKSGIDWNTLSVSYHALSDGVEKAVSINTGTDINANNVLTVDLPLSNGEYIVTVSVNDMSGNTGVTSRRFKIN